MFAFPFRSMTAVVREFIAGSGLFGIRDIVQYFASHYTSCTACNFEVNCSKTILAFFRAVVK